MDSNTLSVLNGPHEYKNGRYVPKEGFSPVAEKAGRGHGMEKEHLAVLDGPHEYDEVSRRYVRVETEEPVVKAEQSDGKPSDSTSVNGIEIADARPLLLEAGYKTDTDEDVVRFLSGLKGKELKSFKADVASKKPQE